MGSQSQRLGIAALVSLAALATACSEDSSDDGVAGGAGGQGGAAGGGAAGGGTGGAGGGGGGAGGAGDLDIGVCAPDKGPFSLTIDNPYLPFVVGKKQDFQGTENGAVIDLRISVLNETELVAGVTTRVVEEREEEDGELIEVSRNFFVQAPDGTVCYYGEDVDIYEAGSIVSHDGAWRAGDNGNLPGIMMPANPQVGMTYQQEVAPGVAMDRAVILAMGESHTVPAGTFTDALRTEDSTPLEPGVTSKKVYAKDVGLIIDEPVELTSK